MTARLRASSNGPYLVSIYMKPRDDALSTSSRLLTAEQNLPSLAHDSPLSFSSADPSSTTSTFVLTSQSSPAYSQQHRSSRRKGAQSNGLLSTTAPDFALTPLNTDHTGPPIQNRSCPQPGQRHSILFSSQGRNGPSESTADPWTSIAITGQPVVDSHRQIQGVHQQPKQRKPITDSGYASSFHSLSLMKSLDPGSRSVGHSYFNDESFEAQMNQTLPDQQLPSPMPHPSGSRPKVGASKTLRAQQSIETFLCPVCTLGFSTHSEHQKHMARHEKKHVCDVPGCPRQGGFATSNDLDRHKKGVHKAVGVDDSVWKCFYPNCKSGEKIWTRQDNFKAHIERMHPEADAEQYVRLSDEWLENDEKPRRRMNLENRSAGMAFAPDPSVGQFQQYSGAVTEHTYPASSVDLPDYPNSVAGEFVTQDPNYFEALPVSPSQQFIAMYGQPYFTPGTNPFAADIDLGRNFSTNPNISLSNMTPSGMHNDPPLALAHRDDDFMENLRNTNMDNPNYLNVIRPTQARTLPDKERMYHSSVPDWQSNGGMDASSPIRDPTNTVPPAESSALLSFVGGDNLNTTPIINLPEGDDLGPEASLTSDISMSGPSPSAEQVTEKNTAMIQEEMNRLFKNHLDPELAKKLQHTFTKTIKEHSSSRSATVGTAQSNLAESHAFAVDATPFRCPRSGCDKRFAKKNRLTKHIKRHDRVFFCTFDNCYKRFGTKTDLRRHEDRVHEEKECWRCWSSTRSRDKRRACTMIFYNEQSFAEHRTVSHSKGKVPLEAFKIDKDFHGAFWCGFCNAVVQNPVPGDADGTGRINWRYQHLEVHMNDSYIKNPHQDAMKDWVELAGSGRTKAEMKTLAKPVTEYVHEGEDSEDEDDAEESSPQTLQPVRSPSRPRAATASGLLPHGPFLYPPPPNRQAANLKRRVDPNTPEDPNSSGFKVPRLRTSMNAVAEGNPLRHGSMSSISAGPRRPAQQHYGVGVDATSTNSIIAYIKCCNMECQSHPRVNNGIRTCPTCWQPTCKNCHFYGHDQKRLHIPYPAEVAPTS